MGGQQPACSSRSQHSRLYGTTSWTEAHQAGWQQCSRASRQLGGPSQAVCCRILPPHPAAALLSCLPAVTSRCGRMLTSTLLSRKLRRSSKPLKRQTQQQRNASSTSRSSRRKQQTAAAPTRWRPWKQQQEQAAEWAQHTQQASCACCRSSVWAGLFAGLAWHGLCMCVATSFIYHACCFKTNSELCPRARVL